MDKYIVLVICLFILGVILVIGEFAVAVHFILKLW